MYLFFTTPRPTLPRWLLPLQPKARKMNDPYVGQTQWFIELDYGSKEYALLVDIICQMDMDLWEIDEEEAADYGFIDLEEENFLPLLCELLFKGWEDGVIAGTVLITEETPLTPKIYAKLKELVESGNWKQVAADTETS